MKALRTASRRLINKVKSISNSLGTDRTCYICKRTFKHFTKYGMGSKGIPEWRKRLNTVGSDIDNFGCMYCRSHDRERHLFMFFDELELWHTMSGAKILHFAPERHLRTRIAEQSPLEYITADVDPKSEGVKPIDATNIPYGDGNFEFIIANHILEHIPEYSKALREFYRVLKPGGIAILQTPYSRLLKNNFEDVNIDTDELRLFYYGEKDHVRIFGEHAFFKSIRDSGFDLKVTRHGDLFDDDMAYTYGVNKKEDLTQAIKRIDK